MTEPRTAHEARQVVMSIEIQLGLAQERLEAARRSSEQIIHTQHGRISRREERIEAAKAEVMRLQRVLCGARADVAAFEAEVAAEKNLGPLEPEL